MAEARNSTTYVETLTSTTAEIRDATSYIEAATILSLSELRIATSYVEVITPAKPTFIGWGTPISF